MASLKATVKELRVMAEQLAESRGLESDELPSRTDAMLLIAAAALKDIEREETTSSELVDAARGARHMLRPHLPRMQRENKEEEGTVDSNKRERAPCVFSEVDDGEKGDLGQYAQTDVFDGNTKKREKFARLMGGRKAEGSSHNTFAADKTTLKRINGELEEQFNTALSRHGKKGLGA